MHYSLYYRDELNIEEQWDKWDLFISAFNLSERLNAVYDKVNANKKYWLVFPEYDFEADELPTEGSYISIDKGTEAQQLLPVFKNINLSDYKSQSICIDATGFMRAQLLFLLAFLKKSGFTHVDFIYSEPNHYSKKEHTTFSSGSIYETRQVLGYQGVNQLIDKKDLLIIAAGYDSSLIARVAQQNENAEIVPLLGFPSLKADMFQENILRTVAAEESFTANSLKDPIFAPASDPFETAHSIYDYIHINKCLDKYNHIYICPLSTKAQTLGIGLCYLNSFEGLPVSVLYPFTERYSKETSKGISKMWLYRFEF
ncbi:hypothetical protein HH219_13130 [Pseudoalteromonas sp. NEC-BIFX-2020_015]|uniref:hypothetical protein n=1 Tax=Pseudoalteromonas sp. NEC-BIFX-2020_015 TaxID=2729544 RepID=UPI0014615BEA|nr:hypothetical protein [Pseudoalteromonas sp. NEC-BIFX-2020_015]NMR26464.1 hypothetical protein [Pseudoalteromonas sp. NEC-BIFX-2020_015]